jgi:predicted transcriptional regulator of viral defense system
MYKKNPLLQFAGIPVTGADIKSCFPDLASPEKKIQLLEKNGVLIRLKRNLYIVNQELTGRETDARLCANHIYGPSYVSFQWALSYYGMIPERVFLMTSATTKRTRYFETPIGNFRYIQVPASYFPIGVECKEEQGVSFLMATKEKALCDTILLDNFVPGQSLKSLAVYLEEDMRLDMDILPELDSEIIEQCAQAGRKAQIFKNLIKLIKQ